MCCRGWRVGDPAAQIDTFFYFRDKNKSEKVAQIASRGEG